MPMKKGSSSDTKPAEVAKQIKSLLKEVPEIRADAARLDELRRVFTRLEAAGELTFDGQAKTDKSSVSAKWNKFLHKSHDSMVSQLCERVRLGRHASIRCLWGVIAGSPRSFSKKSSNNMKKTTSVQYKYLNADLLRKWIWAMTLQESTEMDKGMRHMIEAELISPYRDAQYFSLTAITKLATAVYEGDYEYEIDKTKNDDDDDDYESIDNRKKKVAEKLLELLIMIPVPRSDEELESRKQYLFPPPADISAGDGIPTEDDDTDDESEDDDDDSDSDDGSSEDESSKKAETEARPKKRQKKDTSFKFAFQQMRMFRREYKKAWLAVLRLPLPVTSLKKALNILPNSVLNYVNQPLRFADFFMQAYSDHGSGIIGVLALDGLFLLITKCKFSLSLGRAMAFRMCKHIQITMITFLQQTHKLFKKLFCRRWPGIQELLRPALQVSINKSNVCEIPSSVLFVDDKMFGSKRNASCSLGGGIYQATLSMCPWWTSLECTFCVGFGFQSPQKAPRMQLSDSKEGRDRNGGQFCSRRR